MTEEEQIELESVAEAFAMQVKDKHENDPELVGFLPAWVWLVAQIAFAIAKYCYFRDREKTIKRLADQKIRKRAIQKIFRPGSKVMRYVDAVGPTKTVLPDEIRLKVVDLALQHLAKNGNPELVGCLRGKPD